MIKRGIPQVCLYCHYCGGFVDKKDDIVTCKHIKNMSTEIVGEERIEIELKCSASDTCQYWKFDLTFSGIDI
jgi:hypothetical protein